MTKYESVPNERYGGISIMSSLQEYLGKRGITSEQMENARQITHRLIADREDQPVDNNMQIFLYTAPDARRDAHSETDDDITSDGGFRVRISTILCDELEAIRMAAQTGARQIDVDTLHATDSLWPYVRTSLEVLGFGVRNIVNVNYQRVGAKVFW